jgi:site-specific DNA-methyltransferase (adenine-specific)
MIKPNQLICGDVCVELGKLPSESVDLVIADPPYNLGKDYGNNIDLKAWHEYEDFTRKWLWEIKRILKSTGSLYVFMGVRFISKLFLILDEEMHFIFNGWITWHYTQGMGRKQGFSPRHEDILYFTKTDDFTFHLDDVRIPQKYYRMRNNMQGANPGDVWEFSHVHYCSAEREKHPTQKPEALVERMIRASSSEGDIVIDPFVGSGTTCRVSQVLGRKWIGIDINPSYIDMTRTRISKPYDGFDSYDPRTERTPRDLPSITANRQMVFLEEYKSRHPHVAHKSTQSK